MREAYTMATMQTRSLIDVKNPLDPMDKEARKRGIRFVIVDDGYAISLPAFQRKDKASLVNKVVIVVTQYDTKKRHDIWVVGTYTPNGTWTLWRYFVRPPADQVRYVPKATTAEDIESQLTSRINDACMGLVASGNTLGIFTLEDLCDGRAKFPLYLKPDDDSLVLRCQVKYMKASEITDFYINGFDPLAEIDDQWYRVRVSWRDFMLLDGLNGEVLDVWAKHSDGSFTVHFVGGSDMESSLWSRFYVDDMGTFEVPDPDKL